jgi:predicted outer membrane repeat protein
MNKTAYFITGVLLLTWASLAVGVTVYVPGNYATIQGAIDAAVSGDQIEVAPGTYYEAINFNGKAVRLYSRDGSEVTTIDGTGHYHVVQCASGEGPGTILDGFTITGGNANAILSPADQVGGGMYNAYSSPTVTNCTFSANFAVSFGGGMYNYNSSPTVSNCTFSSNATDYHGGGMFNYTSSPRMNSCTFCDNRAHEGGGMSNILSSFPTVTNCTFNKNKANGSGGGMDNGNNSSPTVANCVFRDNEARYGGGVWGYRSSPKVTNCIFSGNLATSFGGGMGNVLPCSPVVTNCTFSNNSAPLGGGIYHYDCSSTVVNSILYGDSGGELYGVATATVTYSNVQGGWPGDGNIDADPLFVNAAGRDLHLQLGSPCIDAGNNAAVSTSTDPDGNPRIQGVAVDMGAYETTSSPQDVLDRLIDIVVGLDPASLTNPNTGDTLVNKLQATIALIDAGLYQDALMKLQHDILPKTDGCALRGQPDKDDWIITCEGQQQVYPLVLQAIQLLQSP